MDNSQMKAGRFLKTQKGKRIYNSIVSHIQAGGAVNICTSTRIIQVTAKHAAMLKLGKSGSVYLQNGKRWDCIDFCAFRFSV